MSAEKPSNLHAKQHSTTSKVTDITKFATTLTLRRGPGAEVLPPSIASRHIRMADYLRTPPFSPIISRRSSTARSDNSDEVIVFQGRNPCHGRKSHKASTATHVPPPRNTSPAPEGSQHNAVNAQQSEALDTTTRSRQLDTAPIHGGQFSVLTEDLCNLGFVDSDGGPLSDDNSPLDASSHQLGATTDRLFPQRASRGYMQSLGDREKRAGPPVNYNRQVVYEDCGSAYDFDVMDWERPSLRNGSKHHNGRPLETIETEAPREMLNMWARSRLKKKLRKAERETLRAQGHLSSKCQPNSKKPNSDLDCTTLKQELSTFLKSNAERCVSLQSGAPISFA